MSVKMINTTVVGNRMNLLLLQKDNGVMAIGAFAGTGTPLYVVNLE
jgi:hypothetical protein